MTEKKKVNFAKELSKKRGKTLLVLGVVIFTFLSYKDVGGAWYSYEVLFSDWRGFPAVDYSTNEPCSHWYSGKASKYFRMENMKEFVEDSFKDTVSVGIDYYGLMPISGEIAFEFHSPEMIKGLMAGHVYLAKAYKGRIWIVR